MKVSQASKLSSANTNGKGFRRKKFNAPSVTSVRWGTVKQSFLTSLATDKLGSSDCLPNTAEEINSVAFGCYSVKELPFILQALGFNGDAYPVKKKDLVRAAIACFDANATAPSARADTEHNSEGTSILTTSALNQSSAASMVSVSPQAPAASISGPGLAGSSDHGCPSADGSFGSGTQG